MKKIMVAALLSLPLFTLHAQLAGTKWKAKINAGQMINVILDFKNDTCSIYNMADSETIESMTYKLKDSILTLQKIEGQSDCDTSTTGTYKFFVKDSALYIVLKSDDCDDRSSTIDNTRWLPWIVPAEIKVEETILQQYVGTYELDSAHPIYITRENGRLQIEGPNNQLPKSPLIAETNTKFFLQIAGVHMDFVKDTAGNVIKLVSHEEKDYELKKVK
jgi:hypothetical protein